MFWTMTSQMTAPKKRVPQVDRIVLAMVIAESWNRKIKLAIKTTPPKSNHRKLNSDRARLYENNTLAPAKKAIEMPMI